MNKETLQEVIFMKIWMSGEVFEKVFPNFYDPDVKEIREAKVVLDEENDMLKVWYVQVWDQNGEMYEYDEALGARWEMTEEDWERLIKAISTGEAKIKA